MKINIVNPYNSTAMYRMVEPFKELVRLYHVDINPDMDVTADLNIHMPFHSLIPERDYGTGKHIAVYTHCNPGMESALVEACNRADMITAMSFQGRRELLNYGVDPKKIWVIPAAADNFNYRKRTILIVGYPQPNGRKHESILLDMAWGYDLSMFEIVLVGIHWEATTEMLRSLGVSAACIHADNDEKLKQLYHTTDLFIATGYREGGPLPLLEAMASGLPVLSPHFGYAADLLRTDDLYTDVADLMDKIYKRFANSLHYFKLARAWSWRDYAAEYALIIGRMFGATTDLYPERGMSRYNQLLDLIDEIKPKRICEIGTWNGNRAIQMLQQAGKYYSAERLRYQGFDLFDQQTGEQFTREFSKSAWAEGVVYQRINATGADVDLIAGDTQETIVNLLKSDLYFVDGGHSFDTVENDGREVLTLLSDGGVAVFDDYYHTPVDGIGCNKFIDTLSAEWKVTHLPIVTTNSDGMKIGMVKVCRNMSMVA